MTVSLTSIDIVDADDLERCELAVLRAALSFGLARLISDTPLIAEMDAERAMRDAARAYTMEAMADRLVDLDALREAAKADRAAINARRSA